MSPAEQKQFPSSSNVLLQGESLSLPEWLEISWFYPDGFRKEYVLETPDAWLSFGKEIVYKFLKVPHSSQHTNQEIFETRWRLSCEEIADNQQLSPDLYLGLRLLRWVDEEPQWISERPQRDIHLLRPPEDANDVAIVMRRIPQEHFLHRHIDSEEGISETRIHHLARKLQTFHQANKSNGTRVFLQEPRSFLAAVKNTYLEPLRQFGITDGSFLDSFTQIAFQEIRAYLETFLDQHSDRLLERGKNGNVIDCHGSLRLDRISFSEKTPSSPSRSSLFGRLPRRAPARRNDIMSDVAALSGDFEARGFTQAAKLFEEAYARRAGQKFETDLFQFFKTAEAVRRALLLFSGKVESPPAIATNYLSLALRSALGLDKAFLVAIDNASGKFSETLARGLEEMTACVLISDCVPISDKDSSPTQEHRKPEISKTLGLLKQAERSLIDGKSITLLADLSREEDRQELVRTARKYEFPVLLVGCELGREERTLARAHQNQKDCLVLPKLRDLTTWEYRSGALQLAPTLIIEPTLPQADLALMTLHALRRGMKKQSSRVQKLSSHPAKEKISA